MSENFLAVVPNESLPSLRDKFKDNWPDHILAFTFIKKTIEFRLSNPEIDDKVKILCLNGEWTNGTFVALLVRIALCSLPYFILTHFLARERYFLCVSRAGSYKS